MWPYWLLFLVPAFQAVATSRHASHSLQSTPWPNLWRVMFVCVTFMVGLRHEVGGDWLPYIAYVETAEKDEFAEMFDRGELAYSALNWFSAHSGLGVYLVNLVFGLFFTWGLLAFCRNQPRSWLAMTVAVPYLITVVAMGYSRQGVAIGLVMLGLVALAEKSTLRFLLWVGIAALFHKTAVILLPLAALAGSRRPVVTLFLAAVTTVVLFVLLLLDSVGDILNNYVGAEYESSGAVIRIAMNVLPAIVFLVLRKRFALTKEQRAFWIWMAWGAIGFVVLFYFSPSSTAVDRLALYWIPLQLFVWSRLPDAIGGGGGVNVFSVYAIVVYSAVVHFIWLVFSTHSYLWLPYQFYPWVWLWR